MPEFLRRKAPWRNGWRNDGVGSCRRELLDHVIPFNEQHLRRLMTDFIRSYHADRIHDSLATAAAAICTASGSALSGIAPGTTSSRAKFHYPLIQRERRDLAQQFALARS